MRHVTERVIEALLDVAPDEIDAYFQPRSRYPSLCVFSTRVGMDALAYFGVTAKPLPVKALAANREYVELTERVWSGERPTEEELLATGAQYVEILTEGEGMMQANGKRGWPGHLVLALPDRDELIDLDMIQFHRPKKNILVPRAGVLGVPPGFWDGDPAHWVFERDTVVRLELLKPNVDFRKGGDWRTKNKVTGKVIRAMRAQLEDS